MGPFFERLPIVLAWKQVEGDLATEDESGTVRGSQVLGHSMSIIRNFVINWEIYDDDCEVCLVLKLSGTDLHAQKAAL